ncbi:MAG: (5-formylfuran-3-yl)methyl phosphate synthase [Bacteroidota bacterium]
MTRLLASVRDGAEAADALAAGAEIIDFKDPAHGALGALPPDEIGRGIAAVAGRALTSATAGDWPLEPHLLVEAARRVGATGVDYVKLGLLPGAALPACIRGLRDVAREHRLVAVFFAVRGVPLAALAPLRAAGFAGAMLDTAEKAGGGLRRHLDDAALTRFVGLAREAGLMTGLAGSLRLEDIPPLARIGPDLLGFRGALCAEGRSSVLSAERTRLVRSALDGVTA